MDKLKNIIDEERGGPDLYYNVCNELVTLAALSAVHCEIMTAVGTALNVAEEEYNNSNTDDEGEFLKIKLLLEYASECLTKLFPWKNMQGEERW
jgi:hypothetical protein